MASHLKVQFSRVDTAAKHVAQRITQMTFLEPRRLQQALFGQLQGISIRIGHCDPLLRGLQRRL